MGPGVNWDWPVRPAPGRLAWGMGARNTPRAGNATFCGISPGSLRVWRSAWRHRRRPTTPASAAAGRSDRFEAAASAFPAGASGVATRAARARPCSARPRLSPEPAAPSRFRPASHRPDSPSRLPPGLIPPGGAPSGAPGRACTQCACMPFSKLSSGVTRASRAKTRPAAAPTSVGPDIGRNVSLRRRYSSRSFPAGGRSWGGSSPSVPEAASPGTTMRPAGTAGTSVSRCQRSTTSARWVPRSASPGEGGGPNRRSGAWSSNCRGRASTMTLPPIRRRVATSMAERAPPGGFDVWVRDASRAGGTGRRESDYVTDDRRRAAPLGHGVHRGQQRHPAAGSVRHRQPGAGRPQSYRHLTVA